MVTTNGFAEIGSMMGDPGRANMLVALMDNRALTATELATVAGVTPQTASSHLAKLLAAGLIAMERQGRHRYHRLATPAIARMVESMMIAAAGTASTLGPPPRTGPKERAMRQARTCYDHLAGRVAVAIADAMLERGEVELGTNGGTLTARGSAWLGEIGVALPLSENSRKRIVCRPCLDWSERRPHIAGMVGAALLDHLLGKGWLRKTPGSRAITVTPDGQRRLGDAFGLDAALWRYDSV